MNAQTDGPETYTVAECEARGGGADGKCSNPAEHRAEELTMEQFVTKYHIIATATPAASNPAMNAGTEGDTEFVRTASHWKVTLTAPYAPGTHYQRRMTVPCTPRLRPLPMSSDAL